MMLLGIGSKVIMNDSTFVVKAISKDGVSLVGEKFSLVLPLKEIEAMV